MKNLLPVVMHNSSRDRRHFGAPAPVACRPLCRGVCQVEGTLATDYDFTSASGHGLPESDRTSEKIAPWLNVVLRR